MILHPPTSLAELERLASNPVDPEYEAWRAVRKRYVLREGRILPVRTIGGSSFITGTQTELIYANVTSATAKNTWTTEVTINDEAGMGPAAHIPADFFQPAGAVAKAVRIVVRGLVSDTATPTFTFTVRGGTKANITAAILGGTGLVVGLSGISNQLWEMEFDVVMRAIGTTPASSTVQGLGLFGSPGGFTSAATMAVWGGAAQPGTVATFDPSIVNYINVNGTCSLSSGSNGLTVLQLLVFGLN